MTEDELLERVRAISMALPEATEKLSWDTHPTFRVRDKIFAMFMVNHHGSGHVGCWCKAEPGVQAALVGSDPARYFVPPYVGPSGWIGVRMDDGLDWDEFAEHVEESYRLVAPKRLARLLDAARADGGVG
jgi:predicted DNA-binding protein (MmcQ/YjbR family)